MLFEYKDAEYFLVLNGPWEIVLVESPPATRVVSLNDKFFSALKPGTNESETRDISDTLTGCKMARISLVMVTVR